MSSVDAPLGPPDLPTYTPYHHMADNPSTNGGPNGSGNGNGNGPDSRRPRNVPVDHPYMNGQVPQSAHGRHSPIKRSGSVSDDGNRSRNAKAQRRHREKRKAQLRLLEHKVVELEAQCESLTHKLNQCVSEGRGPVPSMQEFEAMQAENAYLRQENQELRRQFGGRPPYSAGGMPPPGLDDSKPGDGARFSGDYSSPRGYERANAEYGHDSGSNPSSSSGFIDQMGPMSRQHRSRMSISSGLASSPYVSSASAFPPDPRHHAMDARYSSSSAGSGSGHYDHPYGPPSHSVPRSAVVYSSGGPENYSRESESWNNGPPPFTSQVPYGVYPDGHGSAPPPHQYSGTSSHHQALEFADSTTPSAHAYGDAPGSSHGNGNANDDF